MSMLEDVHLLRSLFAEDTTELPNSWTITRPSIGHCHVASIIIYRLWGGRILTGMSVADAQIRNRHYWNDFNGVTLDATRDQFSDHTTFTLVLDATGEALNSTTQEKLGLLERRFTAAKRPSRLPVKMGLRTV